MIIRIYQKTISFDHGALRFLYPEGYCRYRPTCSEYARQAVIKFGPIKGMYLGTWRVLRCHPWADGGVDKVP